LAVEAATLVAGDVAGIDLNSGCPKPFSTCGGMGAALLRTPDLLCSILEALVAEVGNKFEIGISVKIRLLETPEETEALVKRLVKTGITGLTIHCRTRDMRPRERAIREQLSMIANICREAGVACLMNGDVKNREDALRLAKEYGCDGGMIARAAEENPSCFRTAEQGGLLPWKEVAYEYVKYALSVDNRWANTKFMLGQIIPGKQAVYKPVSQSRGYRVICDLLDFNDLKEKATAVDERMTIGQFRVEPTKKDKKRAHVSEDNEKKEAKKARPTTVEAVPRPGLFEREDAGNVAVAI
jgi:tRNA-dihydrouridine synthase 2